MKHKRILICVVLLVLAGIGIYTFTSSDSTDKTPTAKLTKDTKAPDTPSAPEKETPPPAFNKSQYSLDEPTSIWVVANKARPLQPKDYAPNDLISVGGGQRMRKEAANALVQLFAAAKAQGYTLKPLSGYRSYGTQVSVYNNEVRTNGQTVADTQSARPGTSEHQTGLAIDVGGGGCGIEDCFGNTPEGKWLAANGYKYGFIIRYPESKMSVTGYRYEPWHIRYIGSALATELHNTGTQTLEEFFNLGPAPKYTN